MIRAFLKVCMEIGSYFVSASTNIRHHHHVMMMMPFICSFRNKNEPVAIYPSFGYSLGDRGAGEVRIMTCERARSILS
jgi:hypothetical protein